MNLSFCRQFDLRHHTPSTIDIGMTHLYVGCRWFFADDVFTPIWKELFLLLGELSFTPIALGQVSTKPWVLRYIALGQVSTKPWILDRYPKRTCLEVDTYLLQTIIWGIHVDLRGCNVSRRLQHSTLAGKVVVSSGRSGFLEANLIRIRISIWDGVIVLG